LANGFNFFNPNFWSFGQQSLVAVRPPPKQPHPPKKFTPKEEKTSQRKPSKTTRKPGNPRTTTTGRTRSSTSTTTTTIKPTTDGPFRIALPTLNFASDTKNRENDKEKGKRAAAELRLKFDCPRENEVRFQLFPKICKADRDCAVWQRDELCCDIFGASSCVSGVPKPLEETPHARE